jgi:hypothetical protein
MTNPLEIDFLKQEPFTQNMLDWTLMNIQNQTNSFCERHGASADSA